MAKARSRSTMAAFLATMLLAIGAGTTSAGEPPPVVNWGWVTVRDSGSSADPAARDQGNSAGSGNHITYNGNGQYTIVMDDIQGLYGIVHVTPLGNTTNVCEVAEWASTTHLVINVACFTRTGAPAATRFTASYLASESHTGRLAHIWADQPTATDYTPAVGYNYNSAFGSNTVHRSGVGDYIVTLPNLGSTRGHVQVTSYETAGPLAGGPRTTTLPAVCSVAGWGRELEDMLVSVLCRDSTGNATDTKFTMTFMQGLGLKAQGGQRVAYLRATRSNVASYTPDTDFSFSTGGTPTMTRQGAGRYTATLPGLPKGGAVQVTAYGYAVKRCIVGQIRSDGTPQQVKIRCFLYDGTLANAKFTLAYER